MARRTTTSRFASGLEPIESTLSPRFFITGGLSRCPWLAVWGAKDYAYGAAESALRNYLETNCDGGSPIPGSTTPLNASGARLFPRRSLPARIASPLRSLLPTAVSYTHLRAHETRHDLVCRLLPTSTCLYSAAASDVYKRQPLNASGARLFPRRSLPARIASPLRSLLPT